MGTPESVKRDELIAVDPNLNKRVRSATTTWKKIVTAFMPHVPLPSRAMQIITLVHITIAVGLWMLIPQSTFPSPVSIARAFVYLWTEKGLGQDLIISLRFNVMMIALLIPLGVIAIIARGLSATKGLVTIIGTFRFLGMAGLTLLFTYYTSGAQSLRLSILVFFVGTYYVTSLARIVDAVPQAERDYVRTLGMSEWQAMYEIDLRGRAYEMFEALRQNQAMGWMMLTTVEGITKGAGGIGVQLLDSQRTWNLDQVYAIQITFYLIGLLIDFGMIKGIKAMLPWAGLREGRK